MTSEYFPEKVHAKLVEQVTVRYWSHEVKISAFDVHSVHAMWTIDYRSWFRKTHCTPMSTSRPTFSLRLVAFHKPLPLHLSSPCSCRLVYPSFFILRCPMSCFPSLFAAFSIWSHFMNSTLHPASDHMTASDYEHVLAHRTHIGPRVVVYRVGQIKWHHFTFLLVTN